MVEGHVCGEFHCEAVFRQIRDADGNDAEVEADAELRDYGLTGLCSFIIS